MLSRSFPSLTCSVPLLGYGCMRLPTPADDKKTIDAEAARTLLEYAYEHGVTYFDVAYPYMDEKAEEFVASVLCQYPRESYYLADKMPVWLIKKEEDLERIFAEQLKRCRTDYFDFYLSHSMDKENLEICRKFDVFRFLERKKEEGYIRNLGFSFHDSLPVLENILQEGHWDFAQIQFNYIDYDLQNAKAQYERIAQHGIPCSVMEPLRGGTLATLCEKSRAVLQEAAPNRSVASWALRFAAQQPNVFCVLSGMNAPEQLQDNLATMESELAFTPAEETALQKALELYRANPTVPCTGCRYCMDCPTGVDIPQMFRLYNQYRLDNRSMPYSVAYWQLDESAHADKCIGCKRCEKLCPQHIRIAEKMQEIKEAMDKILEKERQIAEERKKKQEEKERAKKE